MYSSQFLNVMNDLYQSFEWWCTFFIHPLLPETSTTHTFWHCYCMNLQLQSERYMFLRISIPAITFLCHSAVFALSFLLSVICSVFMNIMNETTYITHFKHAGHIHIVTIHVVICGIQVFIFHDFSSSWTVQSIYSGFRTNELE